jgi:hypothetical protein
MPRITSFGLAPCELFERQRLTEPKISGGKTYRGLIFSFLPAVLNFDNPSDVLMEMELWPMSRLSNAFWVRRVGVCDQMKTCCIE